MAYAVAQPFPALHHLPDLMAPVAGEPMAVSLLRQQALERFYQLGLPTRRQEEWRFTDLRSLGTTRFLPPPARPAAGDRVSRRLLERAALPGTRCLILVDGTLVPELSQPGPGDSGLLVSGLAEALLLDGHRIEQHLGRYATIDQKPFVALNTASLRDGACVLLPPGLALDEPIHLVFLSSESDQPKISYPRCLVVAGAGARATIIESHLGHAGQTLSCPVTELVLGAGAEIDHSIVIDQAPEGSHIATLQAHQEQGSALRLHTMVLGGKLVRNDIDVELDGEHAVATLDGLYLAGKGQHVDNHLLVRHRQPRCRSSQLFKGILDDDASAVFNGLIVVEQDAQQTDAVQTNRNLLRSAQARVFSNPQLEIFADDVRCTHGSTVGQLDQAAVQYLRSRGIPKVEAEHLLTWAFAGEVVDKIACAALRAAVEQRLAGRLGKEAA